MHLTIKLYSSDLGSMVIFVTRNYYYTVEKLTIDHVISLANACTHSAIASCVSALPRVSSESSDQEKEMLLFF